MIIRKVSLILMSAALVACGGSDSDNSSSSTTSDNSSVAVSSSPDSSSAASSSAAPIAFDGLPLLEDFDHVVDSDGFFSAAYRSLQGSNTPLYHRLGGTQSFAEGQLTLEGGRFTIGATQPTVNTSASDTGALGELDLSEPYRISFCLLAAEETGASANTRLMVYVDNNTTRGDDSRHGGDSILLREPVANLIPGIRVVINASQGTANSFIQVRTESGARVTLDDLWIGRADDTSTEPGQASCGGQSSSSSDSGEHPMLSQVGNPVNGKLNGYRNWLSNSGTPEQRLAADMTRANNMITWQMPHGGFDKHNVSVYNNPWTGGTRSSSGWTGAGGVELGTIDNDATITEILFLADVYQRSGETAYRDAARDALEFLLTMQYPTGGWPQVYPARSGTSYSNLVTFNDDAMARVLILFDLIDKQEAPLDGDLFSEDQRARIGSAIEKGVEYILNAQIIQDGERTVWCAQHDPVTYAARTGRDYELPSKSGSESVLVVAFLMTRPQTPEIEAAVRGALAWYRNPEVQVANTRYISRPSGNTDNTYNPIQPQVGSTMWYRFYDLDQNVGFFSGRGQNKQYDIMDIEAERRYGYQWGGNYGTQIINYGTSVGY